MPQRFILLAYARTGSSLVMGALNAHPAIVMYNEIFLPFQDVRQKHVQTPSSLYARLDDYYRDGADPVDFLKSHVYGRAYAAEKKAVGFKLSLVQLRTGPESKFWDWLAGATDIRIIHLYRKRLLESYVSYQRAWKTNQWRIASEVHPADADLEPVTVDVDQFRKYADELIAYLAQVQTTFQAHPLLTIEYHDDVVAQFDDTMKKLEAFLDVESMPLPQKLQKQARVPLEESIANFDEVLEGLTGSKYEAYI